MFSPFLLAASLIVCTTGLALADGNKESSAADASTRPKGVSPQLAPLYQERKEFECLDGNKKIPFDQVNDNYCDCADGSDEPGTSACKNGHFYCANLGYRPVTLPSSRVNDFICDCCDGSDEWDSGTECPNICEEMGVKARAEAKQRAEVHEAGYAKRKELAKEGGKMMEEKKTEVERKKTELEQLEELKKAAEEQKNAAEALEKEAKEKHDAKWEETRKEKRKTESEELFRKADGNGDGRISSDELKKLAEYEEEGSGDKAKELLKEIFKEESGDTVDSDGFSENFGIAKQFIREVREARRAKEEAEEQAGKETGEESPEEVEEDEAKGDEKSEDDEWKPPYDEQTQELIDKAEQARKEFDEIADKVSEAESIVRDSESFLNFDYGEDKAWAPLKGQCAELTTPQYVYKLCLFDRTVQKDRNGHSETSLGHWGKWAGPDENTFAAQRYEHGQTCWNGPERSTLVHFECGEELQLVDASEPSKCEYHFNAKSPAACVDPEELRKAEHMEL